LPKEFRFRGDTVAIHREGARVVLEPVASDGWPEGFWERLASFSHEVRRPRQGRLRKLRTW
jgi:virulence-associated protein VagC